MTEDPSQPPKPGDTDRDNRLHDEITVVPNTDKTRLNRLQLEDYREHRERLLTWLLTEGKNPDEKDGYSTSVVENTGYRLSKIYRWKWDREDRYTSTFTTDDADAYVQHVAQQDWGKENKSQYVKALKRLNKWRVHEHGADVWEPEMTFAPGRTEYAPQDYLTREERQAVRDAALEHGSVTSYSNASPEQRDRTNRYLAQRLGKPKARVTRQDWEDATSWKIPSLVWTSLDAGLRPIEVKRSSVSWIDVENAVLRIPKQQSSKNRENWTVSLRTETANALSRWLQERDTRPKYDDTDAIWLTRYANPYSSDSLSDLLSRLCVTAGIDDTDRSLSWYAIRHSTGTYLVEEAGYEAARQQLRHLDERTTMRYDAAPVDERRDALDRIQ